jgi:hypothetical protein
MKELRDIKDLTIHDVSGMYYRVRGLPPAIRRKLCTPFSRTVISPETYTSSVQFSGGVAVLETGSLLVGGGCGGACGALNHGIWMGPPQGERAPMVGPTSIVILARE